MANYTTNLHLILPLGSKYWNYDTWNENMKILDTAFLDIQEYIFTQFTADNTSVSNPKLEATNMQDAIDELKDRNSSLRYITVTEDCEILIPSESHTYIVLSFGDTVYDVQFVKTPSDREFTWMNDYPTFEPNKTYEISFLYLSAVWCEKRGIDYSQFFEYYIEDDVLYVTEIKAQEWYAQFGNYDFYIPDTLLDYPVMIDDN